MYVIFEVLNIVQVLFHDKPLMNVVHIRISPIMHIINKYDNNLQLSAFKLDAQN